MVFTRPPADHIPLVAIYSPAGSWHLRDGERRDCLAYILEHNPELSCIIANDGESIPDLRARMFREMRSRKIEPVAGCP